MRAFVVLISVAWLSPERFFSVALSSKFDLICSDLVRFEVSLIHRTTTVLGQSWQYSLPLTSSQIPRRKPNELKCHKLLL